MDEIIAHVAERAGIPADKARLAVDAVLGFVKQKLPSQLAPQLDRAVSGGSVSDAPVGLGEVAKDTLGRTFGKEG